MQLCNNCNKQSAVLHCPCAGEMGCNAPLFRESYDTTLPPSRLKSLMFRCLPLSYLVSAAPFLRKTALKTRRSCPSGRTTLPTTAPRSTAATTPTSAHARPGRRRMQRRVVSTAAVFVSGFGGMDTGGLFAAVRARSAWLPRHGYSSGRSCGGCGSEVFLCDVVDYIAEKRSTL